MQELYIGSNQDIQVRITDPSPANQLRMNLSGILNLNIHCASEMWSSGCVLGVFPFRLSCKIQVKKVKKSTKTKWEFCWFLCKNKVVN